MATSGRYTLAMARRVAELDMSRFESRFAQACIEADVPVSYVARAMGVSRPTVYSWFHGRAYPTYTQLAKLRRIAAELDLPV